MFRTILIFVGLHSFTGMCCDYQLPYYDVVPADPSIKEMRAIVVENGYRPHVEADWKQEIVSGRDTCWMGIVWTGQICGRGTCGRGTCVGKGHLCERGTCGRAPV